MRAMFGVRAAAPAKNCDIVALEFDVATRFQ
jgi:hypothetical protein